MKNTAYISAWLLPLLLLSLWLPAQSLYKISLDEKVKKSQLIVEGKVVSQRSFWNPQRTMIFTANSIEVYKIFKGNTDKTTIDIVTQGGTVDGISIKAGDLLKLKKGETGIFFCHPNKINLKSPATKNVLWDVYSSAQGFYKYNLWKGKAGAPFEQPNDIEAMLYKNITARTGKPYQNKNLRFSVKSFAEQQRVMDIAPAIASFSPATVHAGAVSDAANNVLTIRGSGFGTGSGVAAVLFDDADDGNGGTDYEIYYDDPHVLAWTDTEIKIQVPTNAGTGFFSVRDAAGTVGSSPAELNVLYSIYSGYFDFAGNWYVKEFNLINDNGAGGYTVRYSNNTAGSGVDLNTHPAKATLQRAMDTWKETAGLNVTEGSPTTVQAVAYDGINAVMFDNANTGNPPLPEGVLGVCYSMSGICPDNPANAAVTLEFDIVIRNTGFSEGSTAFSLGPCPPNSSNYAETDLETVLLHELGHALSLGHINDSYQGGLGQVNPGKLMHYALVNSTKRTSPDYAAKAGALYAIARQGNAYGSCGITEMTPLATITESKDECPLSFPATVTPAGTTVRFDLAHATSNRFVDPAYNQVRCDGAGTGITNNAYYTFKTGSAGNLSVTVSGYNTLPLASASCLPVYGWAPEITGVRLALYQVSSCPTAQSFPAPVACRTISGNGALASFTGLQANQTYLLYVDGIENTKAVFDLTLGTAVLPLKITSFTGQAFDMYNRLAWSADFVQDVEKLVVEKSIDGIKFSPAGGITNANLFNKGSFDDRQPLNGPNYYRLAIINTNGTKDYSATVQVKRSNETRFTVYPNPADDFIRVRLQAPEQNTYALHLINSIGQVLLKSTLEAGASDVQLQVKHLPAGLYQLNIYNRNNEKVESQKIKIK